jgi:hypothetical protein
MSTDLWPDRKSMPGCSTACAAAHGWRSCFWRSGAHTPASSTARSDSATGRRPQHRSHRLHGHGTLITGRLSQGDALPHTANHAGIDQKRRSWQPARLPIRKPGESSLPEFRSTERSGRFPGRAGRKLESAMRARRFDRVRRQRRNSAQHKAPFLSTIQICRLRQ